MDELTNGLYCVDSCLYVKQLDLLVISDVQFGQEEELRSKGSLVLDQELTTTKKKLTNAFSKTNASRLLINGDIKHEFSRINNQEWSALLELFSFIQKQGVELILVRGNHDNMLEPIIKKTNLELVNSFFEEGYLFCHGHIIPKQEVLENAHTIIIGHEHPALRVSDGIRSEVVKTFLFGSFKDKALVIIPSFSEVTKGTDILTSNGLGPFFSQNNSFVVFGLVDGKPLRFGTSKELASMFCK